ncbi:MAG: glutamine-hydrolyzing GMP synthase, partial [Candidatus Levybacteria bacterium]|nr:glutamine-hydrolyzing GMP synthase [Candidatus Levybacteria bacterium]
MIFIVDFGSQTTHLIARRIKELGAEVKIVTSQEILGPVQNDNHIKGIILSGGPASVYQKGAPAVDPKIFEQGIPILGICYGLQLMARLLGGKVVSGRKEYGPAIIKFKIQNSKFKITEDLPKSLVVWMSHGDEVVKLPKGFETIGSTEHVPFAFVGNLKRKIFGLQFHPEVEHTQHGLQILKNFIGICDLETGLKVQDKFKIQNLKFKIREIVGEKEYVIGAVSGGVDSTVAAVLTAKAVGKRFIPIYVENGLMREGTKEHVKKIFAKFHSKPIVVNVVGEMVRRLKGVSDPEKKRKIIGSFYIEIFEREMKKLIRSGKKVQFLLQGTIYSDVIESKGTKHASKIKSHHNVGGLPKKMKLKLLEPLRHFYKDEVREIGKQLSLPDEFIHKQPFPGPGYAIRIRGEVTKERLKKEKRADRIVLEELEKAGVLNSIFQSFPVLTGAYSTAVKGDGRLFG